MPHISKRKLSPKVLDHILKSFIFVLTDIKDKESMTQLLDAFLSDTEKIMLAKRIAIVYLLEEGIDQQVIADSLNVTQSTVSRICLWYESKGQGYKIAIQKLKKQRMLESLKDLALKIAAKAIKNARFG